MEGEAEACWGYLKSNELGSPALGLRVTGPLKSLPEKDEILICVDTGYEGFLLLSEEDYKLLGLYLSELPRKYWPEGETVTGEVFKLRRAVALVHVPKAGIRLEGYADTFRGNTENLVGLGFLDGLRLLLNGPAQQACLT